MPKLIYHDSDGIDKSFNLAADPVLIGRAAECQIQTQDAMVSRRHARISWDGNYWVEDLGSSNGVYVGHEKVQKAPFRPGDVVTCGSLVLRLTPDTVRPQTSAIPAHNVPSGTTPAPGVPVAPRTAALPAQELSSGAPPGWGSPAAQNRTGRTPPSGQLTPEMRTSRTPPTGAQARTRTPPMGATATSGMGDAGDLASERRRREEAETALLAAAERVKIAEARAAENENAAREGAILRRKLEQMTIDIRRLKEGSAAAPDDGARAAAENERDRWQQRALELEQQLARAQSAPVGGDPAETDRLRRQVEQMTADLRRLRAGGPVGDQSGKVAELEAALRRAEADRDALRAQGGRGGGGLDPGAADAAIALGDALAELRSSLRAASDEATMLTAPSESVQVVTDALSAATSQLEGARASLRALGKILGVA